MTRWTWMWISLRSLVFVSGLALSGCPKHVLGPTTTDCAGACQRMADLKQNGSDKEACADALSPNGAACPAWHCGDFFTVERAACESHAETCKAFNQCAGSVSP